MPTAPSPRQVEVLRCIVAHLATHGYPPTLAEVRDELRVSSTNTVTCHVQALRRKGLLEPPTPRAARTLRLTPAGQRALREAA